MQSSVVTLSFSYLFVFASLGIPPMLAISIPLAVVMTIRTTRRACRHHEQARLDALGRRYDREFEANL